MKKVNLQLFAKKDEMEKAVLEETGSVDLGTNPTVSERELQLQAQLEAIKAQAAQDKAEAEARIKELTKANEETTGTDLDQNGFLEEFVQIQLIKDNDKYKDDVTISINGINILVKRGIPVQIKRKYALVLESSYRQQMIAADLQTEFANNYEANAKMMG